MTPEERGRARAAEVCRGCTPVLAIDDSADIEERARRRVSARLRFLAAGMGIFDRPDTTWEAPGAKRSELPIRGLSA